MDFEKIQMDSFLKASIPVRFQDVSPFDFEDFIAYLLYEAGYEVEQTDYTGDFGADMIIENEGIRTVVQVKRYQASATVGVHDINQVVAAQTYYQADQAMIIATTSYTSSAIKIAENAGMETWDWDRLSLEISDVFLDGKDYFTYFKNQGDQEMHDETAVQIMPKDFDVFENEKYHALIFEIENISGENLLCRLELPIILTKQKKQLQAIEWMEGYFSGGNIYSGARVEIGCLFLSAQIDGIDQGDRIIQKLHLPDKEQSIISEAYLLEQRKGCGLMILVFLLISLFIY